MFCFGVWGSCDGWFSRLRRALLSFASPKESKQRKGDPGRRPATRGPLRYSVWAGSPQEYYFPMLRIAQGAAELAATRLKQSSPFFRPNLRCSASHKGPGKRHGTTSGSLFQTLFRVSSLGVRRFSPSRRQRRATEALAEKGRGLSEGVARVPQPPPTTSSAGNPAQQGADAGSPFLCVLSFGEAKESAARRKRETPPSHERKTQIPWSVPSFTCPRFHPGFTQNPAIESADQPRPRRDSAGLNAPHPPPPTSSASAASPRPPGRQSPESTLP